MEVMTSALDSRPRSPAATVIGWLALIAAFGSGLLALAHAGLDVPVLSLLGPEGDDAVPVAATIFGIGLALYSVVALGAFSRARWTWPLGVVVNLLALAGGIANYRGIASAIGIALGVLMLVFLFSPGGRQAFRPR
jgi:hypothetical protein